MKYQKGDILVSKRPIIVEHDKNFNKLKSPRRNTKWERLEVVRCETSNSENENEIYTVKSLEDEKEFLTVFGSTLENSYNLSISVIDPVDEDILEAFESMGEESNPRLKIGDILVRKDDCSDKNVLLPEWEEVIVKACLGDDKFGFYRLQSLKPTLCLHYYLLNIEQTCKNFRLKEKTLTDGCDSDTLNRLESMGDEDREKTQST